MPLRQAQGDSRSSYVMLSLSKHLLDTIIFTLYGSFAHGHFIFKN